MRGSALGYSWSEGIQLNKTIKDTWQATITYHSDSNGFSCQYCNNNRSFTGEYFEYRIYIDDVTDMLGGNLKLKLPISLSSSYFEEPPNLYAYPWFFSKQGTGHVVSIESPQIGKNRSIVIYTPPSFHENAYKTYPTVIVFDLNEEVYNVSAELINGPIIKGNVGEFIMVGFGDYIPAGERMDLLTQVSGDGTPYNCINGSLADGCNGCVPSNITDFTDFYWYMYNKCGKNVTVGGKGNDTLDFLIDTVLPKAKQFTNNRARADQPNLGVMGYSLGGLMACHAAWTRPNIFGMAACQSPSFWWPGIKNYTEAAFFFNNVTLKDLDLRNNRPPQKIYLDAGGMETMSPFSLTQAMVAAAYDMTETSFFEWDKNLWASVFPGRPHSSSVWISRMWTPLKIFFPTSPGPIPEKGENSECSSGVSGGDRIEINMFIRIVSISVVAIIQYFKVL